LKRIGVYGGSFDPIHIGHLLIAESARETLGLDEVRFLPASRSPLKTASAPAEDKARLGMLRLAIAGHPQFLIDTRELDRKGVSYTIDSLREMLGNTNHETQTDRDEWFLIIGADSLRDFEKWKEPREILQMVSLAVVSRGGQAPIDWRVLKNLGCSPEQIEGCKSREIKMPQIEISSPDIRRRVQAGKSIRYQVTPAVAAYISAHSLYRTSQTA
jgi:nicotinate-nucleotide adenylyltransferase